MWIKRRRGWEIPESRITPEAHFRNRRALLKAMGLGAGAIAGGGALVAGLGSMRTAEAQWRFGRGPAPERAPDPTADLYPARRNERYTVDRALTPEREATTYNNFYEFGSHKGIASAAQRLPVRPWQVRIEGLVKNPRTVDIDTLIRALPLEERVYRFRCVEAWAMTVPWTGIPMAKLVEYCEPLGSAKYVVMATFGQELSQHAPGLRQSWYPWPYTDGLAIDEAMNELSLIATGIYGKPLPPQNGAPLRLITPWKYGFKQVKSIVRIAFTEERPKGFWEEVQPSEYGFWANINPEVPHPRWSQAEERLLGSGERVPTRLYNGYGDFVANLYVNRRNERLFA
ncbi:MAG: protein-methionine-sulfoxide reductase catalytic subunit MsrP [Alphaproteobacteria bacterium]|nr:protein-methionine-sulfoxide reductase catalytic subunit MsrP [Alphaproteobacteria bacterium]